MNDFPYDNGELEPEELSGSWPIESSDEAVDGDLLHQVEILRDKCACLLRDHEDLTSELTGFRIAYHCALGELYVELERTRLRTERLRTALDIVAQTPELPKDELKDWVGVRTKEQAEKVSRLEDEVKADASVSAEAERKREVSADEHRLLRRLYRKLAIRFHPDLQLDPEAKKSCERMMARIGDHYRARDLEGLEMIAESEGDVMKTVFLEPDEYREWLSSRVERLSVRIDQLEHQIDELWNSDLAVLKRRYGDAEQEGRNLFEEMAATVRAEISEQDEALERLEDQVATLAPEARERIASQFGGER